MNALRFSPLALVLAACPAIGPTPTFKDYCTQRVQIDCEFAKRCLGIPAGKCAELSTPDRCDFKPEANGFEFDAVNAHACLEFLAGLDCDTAFEFNPVCTVNKGKQKRDQACGTGAPCAPDFFCAKGQPSDVCGTCQPRLAETKPCTNGAQCAPGLFCLIASGAESGECRKPLGKNDVCHFGSGATPEPPCRAGYFLPLSSTGFCAPAFEDDTIGKCVVGGGPGAGCDPSGPMNPCRDGTICDTASKQCVRKPITGESCTFDASDPNEAQFNAIDACLNVGYCKQAPGNPPGVGTCARFAKRAETCGTDTSAPFELSLFCDGNSLRCVGGSGGTGFCGGQQPGSACEVNADCSSSCGANKLCTVPATCAGTGGG
jgi:hypothetical protein